MILAEIDESGSLYACGSVNIWIGLIFLGLLAINTPFAVWAFKQDSPIGLLVWFAFLIITVVAGWSFAALLAEGSCS